MKLKNLEDLSKGSRPVLLLGEAGLSVLSLVVLALAVLSLVVLSLSVLSLSVLSLALVVLALRVGPLGLGDVSKGPLDCLRYRWGGWEVGTFGVVTVFISHVGDGDWCAVGGGVRVGPLDGLGFGVFVSCVLQVTLSFGLLAVSGGVAVSERSIGVDFVRFGHDWYVVS